MSATAAFGLRALPVAASFLLFGAPARAADGVGSEAERRFVGTSVGLDLHVEGIALLKQYTTATGRTFWDGGTGAGGSLAVSLHFVAPIAFEEDGRASWLDFEIGLGDAIHDVHWRDGDDGTSTHVGDSETFVRIGPRLASGRLSAIDGRSPWWGYAVSVDWMPTYVYFFGGAHLASGGRMNAAGLGVSIDIGRREAGTWSGSPLFRASFGWLPYVNSLPTALSAGVGCAFY